MRQRSLFMFRPRRLAILLRRAVKTSNGPVAFGLALSLGVGVGALLGMGGARGAKARATAITSARARTIAAELERGLTERRKALRMLAGMPSVVAHRGAEREAFAAFRAVYQDFDDVGIVEDRRVVPHRAPHKGARPYRITVTGSGVSVFGTLAADWPKAMLTGTNRFGTDDRKVSTLLMGAGGSRTLLSRRAARRGDRRVDGRRHRDDVVDRRT